FVTGAGDVVRGGGRVVKNVAGFDLTRLVAGSWGTIGALTEVTVRLHAKPEVDETIALALPSWDLAPVAAMLRAAPFVPFACEILNAALGARLGLPAPTALIRLAGNA